MKKLLLITIISIFGSFCFAIESKAKDFCVSTAADLQAAISETTTNDEDDTINIIQGVYNIIPGSFGYYSEGDKAITIQGGFTADCAFWEDDPSKTLLDAGGSGTALEITQAGGGSVQIGGLTLQNGGRHGLYVRLRNITGGNVGNIFINKNIIRDTKGSVGIYISHEGDSTTGNTSSIFLSNNIIAGNRGDYGAGGLAMRIDYVNWTALVNNIIVGNVGDSAGGVDIIESIGRPIYLTNNTITDNQAVGTLTPVGGITISNNFADGTISFYNNIIRGNSTETGVTDIRLWDFWGTRIGYNNNYSEMFGTWTDSNANVNVSSLFVERGYWSDNGTPDDDSDDFWVDGNYHLTSASPCIDAGNNSAPFLPSEDYEGDPREFDGNDDGTTIVDMGADEYIRPINGLPWLMLLLD